MCSRRTALAAMGRFLLSDYYIRFHGRAEMRPLGRLAVSYWGHARFDMRGRPWLGGDCASAEAEFAMRLGDVEGAQPLTAGDRAARVGTSCAGLRRHRVGQGCSEVLQRPTT